MGETKRTKKTVRAQKLKEQKKNVAFAILRNNPTSPRKMRLVAGLIRNQPANKALDILQFSPQEAAGKLRKLLQSAIANWVNKNENARLEDANLYVKEVKVDGARMLKRLNPAPQGRAYRIRKRSNHVTIVLGTKENKEEINGTEN
ncbi:MAG: 50S ribosomal protein L22 [Bacteroidales bacterium]|jgi:large subunit ribosomal protein L22|nr:50S ribosomal protein L22 [Bacteroidales bacterium]MBQ3617038.1 50S ribosomal protein L22 [Bacteroidales bacterium]MDD6002693.1 50S ribosomal protein L22 [Bacteroidales bacterium]